MMMVCDPLISIAIKVIAGVGILLAYKNHKVPYPSQPYKKKRGKINPINRENKLKPN